MTASEDFHMQPRCRDDLETAVATIFLLGLSGEECLAKEKRKIWQTPPIATQQGETSKKNETTGEPQHKSRKSHRATAPKRESIKEEQHSGASPSFRKNKPPAQKGNASHRDREGKSL